jgi:hypothetical protein
MGRRYSYSFEGDDQLVELNEGISELTEENRQYRRTLEMAIGQHVIWLTHSEKEELYFLVLTQQEIHEHLYVLGKAM